MKFPTEIALIHARQTRMAARSLVPCWPAFMYSPNKIAWKFLNIRDAREAAILAHSQIGRYVVARNLLMLLPLIVQEFINN